MMSVASANRTSGRNLSRHVLYTAVKVLHHSTNLVLIKISYTYISVGNLVDTSFSAMCELVKVMTILSYLIHFINSRYSSCSFCR